MYDLVSIGSATLDIVIKSQKFLISDKHAEKLLTFNYGAKIDVDDMKFVSGGGATNVAVGASRLGLSVAAICEVGKDIASQVILTDLKRDKVDTQYMIRERSEQTAVSALLVCGDGERTALTHRGAAYQLESRDIHWDVLKSTRWVHLGTLGADKQLIFDLFDFARTHELSVSWTPSVKDLQLFLSGSLLPSCIFCDVLILNSQEWADIKDLQKDLLDRIGLIVVSDGDLGGDVYYQHNHAHYDAVRVKTVEVTGAGDAFACGLISGLITGKTLEQCLNQAKHNAASVVQYLGAKEGLLTKEQMAKKLSNF